MTFKFRLLSGIYELYLLCLTKVELCQSTGVLLSLNGAYGSYWVESRIRARFTLLGPEPRWMDSCVHLVRNWVSLLGGVTWDINIHAACNSVCVKPDNIVRSSVKVIEWQVISHTYYQTIVIFLQFSPKNLQFAGTDIFNNLKHTKVFHHLFRMFLLVFSINLS